MPLQIGGSGTIKPFVKFNAKADKWFVRGPDGGDLEIARPAFVMDLDNIATGWLRFREGQPPERVMDPSLSQPAPCPEDGFKRGFVLMTFSPKFFGGAAEFSGTSVHLSNATRDVYSQYEAERAQHRGELPVVACTGSEASRDRYGTNYRPQFKIVQWVERPRDLPNASPVEASEIYRGEQTSRSFPAQHVPPPQRPTAATPPAPATAAPVAEPPAATPASESTLVEPVF